MGKLGEDYHSYLLRLWRAGDEGPAGDTEQAAWRASLESALTGERFSFATLEELFEFLRHQTAGQVHKGTIFLAALLAVFLVPLLLKPQSGSGQAERSLPSKTASSAIAVTSDGQTVLAVNPDSNSLSLIDATGPALAAEVPVGSAPQSVAVSVDGSLAFVANKGSDSVSVVDLAAQAAIAEIPVGDRPVGIVATPGGRFLAVSESGADRIRFLDARDYQTLSRVPVADRPYGLAVTPDGQYLLISHLLSGEVTILALQPYLSYLPAIYVGSGGFGLTPGSGYKPRAPVHGTQSLLSNKPFSVPTWPHVAPAPAVVVNAAGTRAYLPQTMANGLGLNTQFDTTVFPEVSVLDLGTWAHQSGEHISLPETDRPVGLPWDVALAKNDTELWIANAGSNDLSIVDISNPSLPVRRAHLLMGDNPRGVALSPDGGTAYVNNTLAGTVSVVDANAYTVTAVITVTEIPLPPLLLDGKRLFHSSARPELAQAAWISCNTCHIEGEHDGRTWLLQVLGQIPPGGTPVITRNTTSLLGMIQTYPLRWSAEWDESADSEFSIRFEQFGTGLINGPMHPTLGPPNQGRSVDLDSLAAFIDSLAVPPRRHALTAAELRGKAIFESPQTGCSGCHPSPLYTNLHQYDVGTADASGEWLGPEIDTPSLRFLYDSAPYLHDGSAVSLMDVLTTKNPADEHGITSHLTVAEQADLVAFLLALPYTE